MEIKLNDTQNELIKVLKEKGFLTIHDFRKFYTSQITIKSNIDRFTALGYIKKVEDKFEYIKGDEIPVENINE